MEKRSEVCLLTDFCYLLSPEQVYKVSVLFQKMQGLTSSSLLINTGKLDILLITYHIEVKREGRVE